MSHWEFAEDAHRLPEGMKRIGYDADTARYTFCDREGNMYTGPAHERYGSLTPVSKALEDRPNAFASEKPRPDLSVSVGTFHDILPAHLITSPSSADSRLSSSSRGSASENTNTGGTSTRFRDAVRRVKLPAMQNVVTTIRRSTTQRKPQNNGDKVGLLRGDASVTRSATSVSKSSFQSTRDSDGQPPVKQ
ncbi:hypothetical protein FB45DRAFT_919057 [Roridomyces roridus]|uniref:Uncharacterized protein n=1 Tax=Roridomyces roridus TaxID=1738132 RepID=A0AAD7FMH4_9AGAR|nr:hypothetical protein FB45DRAFT_919057 [Roridomyces roridus]